MPKPRRIRARRARARQRSHDLRNRYRQKDLPAEHLGIATIEDPFTPAGYLTAEGELSAEARLAPAQHLDGSVAEGAPGWAPPRRPTMVVVRALKDDPVGRMHSRRQIDEAQFKAARAFQEAADRSMLGSVKSVDLSKTKVSGIIAGDSLTPGRQRAMAALRKAEGALVSRYGTEGLGLCRSVLLDRQSVEQSAKARGAETDREIWFWARLFRRLLDVLALVFGFASSTRWRYRPNGHAEQDPAQDPQRHAIDGEIYDPALRKGRSRAKS
jgi:hypothetical protein